MAHQCLFAAIADDFTGGADLAGMLAASGVRTLQLFGADQRAEVLERARGYDAVVLCLKTRSVPAPEACRESLHALEFLRALPARQVQFKYCSTFDSTDRGNIGPVTDALMTALGVDFTIAVPALPVNRRTQYMGHLFVGSELLADSPMRHHPLNPMTDSNLVRFLQRQTRRRVGLVDLLQLRAGRGLGCDAEIALVDAIEDTDLDLIAAACVDMPLVTGGSGLGMALPRVWRGKGWLEGIADHSTAACTPSGTLILAGSCSAATLHQLRLLEESGCPVLRLDLAALSRDAGAEVNRAMTFALPYLGKHRAVCLRSSAPQNGRTVSAGAGEAIERAFAAIAARAVRKHAVRRLIVAGGETSGAVVQALGVTAAEVVTVIDPGVPAMRSLGEPALDLALKSGNFGAPDFFLKTLRYWDTTA